MKMVNASVLKCNFEPSLIVLPAGVSGTARGTIELEELLLHHTG